MYITEIEVTELQESQQKAHGFVSLHSDKGAVQLHCAVDRSQQTDSRSMLVSEAIRQLTRMPEYRSGHKSLTFAPGLQQIDIAAA